MSSSLYLMKNMTNPPRPGRPPVAFSDDAMEAKLTSTATSHLEGMRTCNSLSKGQRRKEWVNLFASSKAGKRREPPRPVDNPPRREPSPHHDDEEEGSPEASPAEEEVEQQESPAEEEVEQQESPEAEEVEQQESPEVEQQESPEVVEQQESPEVEEGHVVELRQQSDRRRRRPSREEEEEGVRSISLDRGDPRLASGFSMLSVKQLRERCAQAGLAHAKLKKKELVELLQRHSSEEGK